MSDMASKILSGLAKKGKATPTAEMDVITDEPSDSENHLNEISTDILDAIESKDSKALASLLKEAFELLDSTKDEDSEDEE